jgi:hypothetical protein
VCWSKNELILPPLQWPTWKFISLSAALPCPTNAKIKQYASNFRGPVMHECSTTFLWWSFHPTCARPFSFEKLKLFQPGHAQYTGNSHKMALLRSSQPTMFDPRKRLPVRTCCSYI